MASDPTDPSAILAGIRERARLAFAWGLLKPSQAMESQRDVDALLAAVEAVLEAAERMTTESAATAAEADALAAEDAGPPRLALRLAAMSARSIALKMCAQDLREAITSALTGEETGEHD